jgi:hypothetical protein
MANRLTPAVLEDVDAEYACNVSTQTEEQEIVQKKLIPTDDIELWDEIISDVIRQVPAKEYQVLVNLLMEIQTGNITRITLARTRWMEDKYFKYVDLYRYDKRKYGVTPLFWAVLKLGPLNREK